MIELELKYSIQRFPEKLLEFELLSEKNQTDIYYDTTSYDLIKNGNFLRVRNNKKIDFKTNLNDKTHLYCLETSFNIDELSFKQQEINKLLTELGLKYNSVYNDIESFIHNNSFITLSPIKKQRKAYKVETNFTLYVDDVEELGLFLEAELIINQDSVSPEEAKKHKEKINQFLRNNGIINENDKDVNIGYVELYLKKYNPTAYELGMYKS